jgi:hypothetical protein
MTVLATTGKRHSFLSFFMFLRADVHISKYVNRHTDLMIMLKSYVVKQLLYLSIMDTLG